MALFFNILETDFDFNSKKCKSPVEENTNDQEVVDDISPPPKRKCQSDIRDNLLGETFNGDVEAPIVNGGNIDETTNLIEFSKCDETLIGSDLNTPEETQNGPISETTGDSTQNPIELPLISLETEKLPGKPEEEPEKSNELSFTEENRLEEEVKINEVAKSPVPSLKEDEPEIDDLDLMLEEAGLKSVDDDNLYLSEVDDEKEKCQVVNTVIVDSSNEKKESEEIIDEDILLQEPEEKVTLEIIKKSVLDTTQNITDDEKASKKPESIMAVDEIVNLDDFIKDITEPEKVVSPSKIDNEPKDELHQDDPDELLVEIEYQPPDPEQNEEDKRDSDQKSETSSHEPNLMDDNANQNDFETEQSENETVDNENIEEESVSNLNSNDVNIVAPLDDEMEICENNLNLIVEKEKEDFSKCLKRAKTSNNSDNEKSEVEVAPKMKKILLSQEKEEPQQNIDDEKQDATLSSDCMLATTSSAHAEEEVKESEIIEELKVETKPSKLATPIEKSMPLIFLKMFKKPIEELTVPMLEELLMSTLMQTLVYKSELSKVHQKVEQQDKMISAMQRKANELTKHYADMEMIHCRVIKDLETRNEGMVTPVKITRAVGLQVYQPPRSVVKTIVPTTKVPVIEKRNPSPAPVAANPSPANAVVYRKTPEGIRTKTTRKVTPMRPQPPIIPNEIPPEQPKNVLTVKSLESLLTKPLPNIQPKPPPQQIQPKPMQHPISFTPVQKPQQYIINQQLAQQQLQHQQMAGMANKTVYV